MYQINDNELLYLIYDGQEDAIGILFEKYTPLIKKRIKAYNIKPEFYDDYMQEGFIALYNSIKVFNPTFDKTFNKFFDMVLQRRFQTLLSSNKQRFYNEILMSSSDILEEEIFEYEDKTISDERTINTIDQSIFSSFEKDVFNLRYIDFLSIKEIGEALNCSVKKVYNALYQIKKKVKEEDI